MAFELGFANSGGDDRGEAFSNVLAGEVVVFFFEQPFTPRIAVDGAGDRGAKALLVHAAFDGGDAVGETVYAIGVEAGVPLESNFDFVRVFIDLFGADEISDCFEERFF